jgi:hypothetical protein
MFSKVIIFSMFSLFISLKLLKKYFLFLQSFQFDNELPKSINEIDLYSFISKKDDLSSTQPHCKKNKAVSTIPVRLKYETR